MVCGHTAPVKVLPWFWLSDDVTMATVSCAFFCVPKPGSCCESVMLFTLDSSVPIAVWNSVVAFGRDSTLAFCSSDAVLCSYFVHAMGSRCVTVTLLSCSSKDLVVVWGSFVLLAKDRDTELVFDSLLLEEESEGVEGLSVFGVADKASLFLAAVELLDLVGYSGVPSSGLEL